jgi:hypothetical protein
MDWLQLIVNLVVTGILLYVFQRVIDERSARRLEKFKAELKSESFEKETRFSKLHEKRIDVIIGLYGNLYRLRDTLSSILKLLRQEDGNQGENTGRIREAWDKAQTEIEEFKSHLNKNRLLIPDQLCKQLDNYYKKSLQAIASLLLASFNEKNSDLVPESTDISINDSKEDLIRATFILSEQIAPLLVEIEKEFRALLGG